MRPMRRFHAGGVERWAMAMLPMILWHFLDELDAAGERLKDDSTGTWPQRDRLVAWRTQMGIGDNLTLIGDQPISGPDLGA